MRERLLAAVGLVLAAVVATALSSRFGPPLPIAYAAVDLPGTASDQLAVAADALEAAMAKGGSGLTFEVVQRNSLLAKPGGPLIGVRDPDDPARVVEEVDTFSVNAVVTRGAVTGDAFWMEMRLSPGTDATPSFEEAAFFSRVLERDGVIWRDDGDGWYEADVSPGTGMDPVSARLLPKLLRSASNPDKLGHEVVDGRLLPGVAGTASVADYPGVIASDGRDFTEPEFVVTYRLDETGRLVLLQTSAHNLNDSAYELVSETAVSFGYGATGDPPTPEPPMPLLPASPAEVEGEEAAS